MFNDAMGVCEEKAGRAVILTERGRAGHAVYGPYLAIVPGPYTVGFTIIPVDLEACGDDAIVAEIDASVNFGNAILASRAITAGALRSGQDLFALPFVAAEAGLAEFRCKVFGNARLEIGGHRPLFAGEEPDLSKARFPEITAATPDYLRHNEAYIRRHFERGYGVSVIDGELVLDRDGVAFNVRGQDDVNLTDEMFVEKVYDFRFNSPTVIVDIGMNIGLVALQFASNPQVEKVYAFEPFASTYQRAKANLARNPALAEKIVHRNVGVSDRTATVTILAAATEDSGSRTTRDAAVGGIPAELSLCSAPDILRDVVAASAGKAIVVKIDCEGAEFEIIPALDRAGLLRAATAYMVEWHSGMPGRSKHDLIDPLARAGFFVLDRSPLLGNGFFYAIRV